MRFGFHISIAGDLSKAADRASQLSCQTIQIFAGNPRGWKSRDLDPDKAFSLWKALRQKGIRPFFVHMPYLPNLAAMDDGLYEKSVQLLSEILRRSEMLGASGLVTHPGHHGCEDEEKAARRVSDAINHALRVVPNDVMILLENTAGQGTEIGSRFGQLGALLAQVTDQGRVGICLDTAHAFAAGYDLSTREGLDLTLREFEQTIGWDKLCLLHLNDSKAPLGSRVDRHWHIGEGLIGTEGIQRIVNHPLLKELPAIMETPKKSEDDDIRNMRTVCRLVTG